MSRDSSSVPFSMDRITTVYFSSGLTSTVTRSPVGKALMGRRVGDRATVEVSPELKYTVVIRSIEKGTDDESLDISAY